MDIARDDLLGFYIWKCEKIGELRYYSMIKGWVNKLANSTFYTSLDGVTYRLNILKKEKIILPDFIEEDEMKI